MRSFFALLVLVSFPLMARAEDTPAPVQAPVETVAPKNDAHVAEWTGSSLYFDGREVTAAQFFTLTGRPDLADKSVFNIKRRVLLMVTGAAILPVATVVGIAVLSTTPDSETARCQNDQLYFNAVCQPQKQLHQQVGAIVLVAGGLLGLGLITAGVWSLPEVFRKFALNEYIDDYNRAHRPEKKVTVQIAPVVGPAFAGLTGAMTF